MGFLSSLTSTIKKGADKIGNLFSGSNNQASVASAFNSAASSGPQSRLPSQLDSFSSGNVNTSYGKNTALTAAGKRGDAAVRAALPSSSVQNVINQASGGQTGGQSMLPGTPGGQSMVSGGNSVQSTIDKATKGKKRNQTPAVATTVGFSGTGGFNNAMTTPAVGDYGRRLFNAAQGGGGGGSWGSATPTPNGGLPSYTGTLSSTGGLGSPAVNPTGEEEEGPVQSSTLGGSPSATPVPNTLPDVWESSMSSPSLNTPNLGNEFNSSNISAGINTQPLTRETISAELERIKTEALRIKSTLDMGMVDEPIVDTLEQLEFIEMSGDPYGITSAMDNYRRQETNLVGLQKQRQEVFNGINSITQAYEAIYDDIRVNPDLPKGLAKRRLEELYTKQKGTLQNYTTMLESLNMQIEDQNGMVNRAFGIVERAEGKEEKARSRAMEYLNLYISSGAVAGMNDQELKELAEKTGVNVNGLKRIKQVKLNEEQKKDLEITQLANGDTVAIDKSTGKIVSNLGGRKVSTGGSGVYTPGTVQGDLSNQFEIVVGNAGSVSAQEGARTHFNNLMKQGNITEAQRYLDTLTVKGLTASDRTRFTGFGIISRVREQVRSIEDKFEQTKPGVYRTALESAKPFVNASTDPDWQTFVSSVQSAVNAYRNEIFGASLTGNELKAANISLPDWGRDNFGTIITKLDAMQGYAETVRGSLMQDAAGNFATNAIVTGQNTGTPPMQTSLPGEDIFTSTVQPKAEGGYWSNLLKALNPF